MLGYLCFYESSKLETIYYCGTLDEWNKIEIEDDSWFKEMGFDIYCYSENQPTEVGNYWHFDDNSNPVIWE